MLEDIYCNVIYTGVMGTALVPKVTLKGPFTISGNFREKAVYYKLAEIPGVARKIKKKIIELKKDNRIKKKIIELKKSK